MPMGEPTFFSKEIQTPFSYSNDFGYIIITLA
jgi:hypothetical protein